MLISEALEGKYVKSSQGRGTIQEAVKRDNVYTNQGVFAYACRVRPEVSGRKDFWTTVYVGEDN